MRFNLPALEAVMKDLRYGLRMLRRNPGFTAIAVITLALGIGANTAVFSLVDVVLFRPLPIHKPGEVVRVLTGDQQGDTRGLFLSFPGYLRYRDHLSSLSSLAAYVDRFPVNLSAGRQGTERVDCGMVTGNYFQMLGVNAALGRVILPDDDHAGANPVVMLSYSYWRRHFPADASVLGTTVIVDGQPFTVVGVAPAGFGGVSFENLPEVWLPMSYAFQVDPLLKSQIPLQRESFSIVGVVGRLKAGVSLEQARTETETLSAALGAGQSSSSEGRDWRRPWATLRPATDAARQNRTRFSMLVLAIVMIVLLIACADVAGLLLARFEGRQKEIAVRLALGATRSRIMAAHLLEGLLVSFIGAVLGCLFANWATHLLLGSIPPDIPIPVERASSVLDARVLVFAVIAAVLAGVISSLAPALKYSRSDLALTVSSGSRTATAFGRRFTLQSSLVVVQVTASVLLLVGAGLFARTLWQASHVRLGFDPEHTVGGSTDLIRQGYSKTAAANLLEPMLDALRAQPGVKSAALGNLPLQGNMATMVNVEGQPTSEEKKDWIQLVRVSGGYFETMGIPLQHGRDFSPSDRAGAPKVAIINEAMAQHYWPHESPLGKHIAHVGPQDETFEIVGVAGNIATHDLREAAGPLVYFPLAQTYLMFPWQPDATLLARADGDPRTLVPALRAAVARINPDLPLFHIRTLQEQVATTIAEDRFLARLLLAFAFLATLLSAAGVYGLVSYATERATREVGIRMALGAQPGQVLWMVLRQGMLLTVTGVVIGLVAALGLTRVFMSLLYGVSPTDPMTFAAVGVLMLIVSMTACYVPARRALRVDPLVALRQE